MAAKIVAALLVLLGNVVIGVMIFFMMMLAMNGYHGSDAEWGMGAYIILAIIISLSSGFGGWIFTSFLIKKQFSPVMAALTAVPVLLIVGGGLKVVSCLIGIGISEYVRVNY